MHNNFSGIIIFIIIFIITIILILILIFLVYIAAPPTKVWRENKMDHNLAKLISGISDTSLCRNEAAARTVMLMKG